MLRRAFLSRLAGWGIQSGVACCTVGCGTLLHSERCGRLHRGRIDWAVVALDGLGLILFFIPGVIAFVVDFSTGAIYLPETEQTFPEYAPTWAEPIPAPPYEAPVAVPAVQVPSEPVLAPAAGPHVPARPLGEAAGLKRILVARDELGRERIEQVVTYHVGRPVSLHSTDTRISRLPRLDRFANQWLQHHTNRSFGLPAKTFFDDLKRA